MADVVLEHAPDLADGVMSGATPLNDAYEKAQQRKKRAKSAESRLAILQIEDPQLATLVVEESLSIDEAWHTWEKRVKREEDDRRELTRSTAKAMVSMWAVSVAGVDKIVGEWVDDANTERDRHADIDRLWTGDGQREMAEFFRKLAAATDRRGGLNRESK